MLKETLLLFSDKLSRRQTVKEKQRFINTVAQPLLNQHIPVQLHRHPNKRVTSQNIQIGDLNHCRLMIVCGYDTASLMLNPSAGYYPLDAARNKRTEQRNLLTYLVLALSALLVIFWLAGRTEWYLLIIKLACGAGLLFAVVMPSSRFNLNRNSAAAAVTFELAAQHYQQTAFVFTDQTISSYLGYQQLADWCPPDAAKHFILLEALACGKQLYVGGRANDAFGQDLAVKLKAEYLGLTPEQVDNCSLKLFHHSVVIFTADEHQQVTPSRSYRDQHVDIKRLEQILDVLSQFCQTYEA
ncbi:hypothetical protein SDC9_99451 [bioreactor metagenome]|uniref:Uncharacterized protein n=1 Tax=bioreactor metagenome TaxID=1076179 RepID=A0A645AHM9_9ZZZZ